MLHKGVDILVSPEYSIQSLEMPNLDRDILAYSQTVPEPSLESVPCDDTSEQPYYQVRWS